MSMNLLAAASLNLWDIVLIVVLALVLTGAVVLNIRRKKNSSCCSGGPDCEKCRKRNGCR